MLFLLFQYQDNQYLRHNSGELWPMDAPEESAAQNYLQSHMYYLKPIQGTMQRDGKSVLKNFTDECEWRFRQFLTN